MHGKKETDSLKTETDSRQKKKAVRVYNLVPILPSPYYQVMEDEQVEKDRINEMFDLDFIET